MVSLSGIVWLVVYLVVAGLVFWLLHFLIDYVAPPEPFRKVAKVALVVLAVLVLIGLLLSLVGYGPVFRP
jgi:hypothetical protein